MDALILVDIQNDFLPGGPLGVPQGDEVIAVANRLMKDFDLVVATQDYHPANHGSFAANHDGKHPGEVVDLFGLSQILWPVHCVQETRGAEFAADLDSVGIQRVFQKGLDPQVDSYSGFFDNDHRNDTGLADFLQIKDVASVYVMGLATDYCVKFTAIDSAICGFETYVIMDGCRGVELNEGDCQNAIDEMQAAGVTPIQSDDLPLV